MIEGGKKKEKYIIHNFDNNLYTNLFIKNISFIFLLLTTCISVIICVVYTYGGGLDGRSATTYFISLFFLFREIYSVKIHSTDEIVNYKENIIK